MMMPCARQHLEISSQDPVFLWGCSLNLAQLERASWESEEPPDTRKWCLTRPRWRGIRTCCLFRPSPYTDLRVSRDGPQFAARVICGSSEDRKACFLTNGWFKWDVGSPPGVAMEQLPTRGRSK